MFMRAGAQNVAADSIKGYKQVSAEQILAWAPQMIFVQDRYSQVPAELKSNPQLTNLSAVKEDKIYMMPEYAKAWGYPTAEAMAFGASGG
jgi:ABC-transporter periplasmic-binding component